MKNLHLIIILIWSITFMACNGNAQTDEQSSTNKSTYIQVIDFHTTHRCVTCKAIEKQAIDALNNHFKSELDNGIVTFQTINIDDESNYAIAEEFEASGTALFINIISNGISTKVDLTQFSFMNAMSEDDSFEKGFVEEINKALDSIKQ
jgi:hypothetical protein